MEYTKVLSALSRVKDAITTKLDAIKSDVTNVNNSVTNLPTTLDSKFSALTSKVDGVKTDVAGVGSKVDGVHGLLEKETAVTTFYTKENSHIVTLRELGKGQSVDFVDIAGRGKIIGFSFTGSPYLTIIMNIDGKNIEFRSSSENGVPNMYYHSFNFYSYDSCNRFDGRARSVLVFDDSLDSQNDTTFPTREIFSDSGRVIRFEDFLKHNYIVTNDSDDTKFGGHRKIYKSASSIIYPCIRFENNFSIKMSADSSYDILPEALVVYTLDE